MEAPCSLSTSTTEMEITYYLLNNYSIPINNSSRSSVNFRYIVQADRRAVKLTPPPKIQITPNASTMTTTKQREKRGNTTTVPSIRVGAAPEHLPAPASGATTTDDGPVHPLHRGCRRQDLPELHLGW